MAFLHGLLWPFQTWNDYVLRIGRAISLVAIALMVLAILIQVFFRYALNNALPWPDEAARFMMLWMTGFMAPLAYRQGGFVAIDMLIEALPKAIGSALSLCLLIISGFVLVMAVQIGWGEVTGFSGKFATSSLFVPGNGSGFCEALGAKGVGSGPWCRVPRSWMMLSFFLGMSFMLIVNIEMVLRTLITLLGGEVRDLTPSDAEALVE
ncbi:TRAP transporter small permease subunit [uncultured Boseongicola sp.]|jgi:TRAP-type C4-dicarboxylate transport system permease small subunit|uniref:TRAP transporter small permease n=1 Tax=uncultured Boseongicola sp. TaxID=1648499 RepID=UPI00262159A0|nr:TRAP transporter small permease subunit [uncultured Boseongicola sp.]